MRLRTGLTGRDRVGIGVGSSGVAGEIASGAPTCGDTNGSRPLIAFATGLPH